MNRTDKLCTELLSEYKDFSTYKKSKSFVGYKLSTKKAGSYYSIVTGLFRYKPRNIDANSYSQLYVKEKFHYNERLRDKLSIFVNKEDAIKALIKYKDIDEHKNELALLEITISKSLEKAEYSNKFISDAPVVIGKCIDKVKEIEIITKKNGKK